MEKKQILDWLNKSTGCARQGLKGLSHIVVVIDLIAQDSESLGGHDGIKTLSAMLLNQYY